MGNVVSWPSGDNLGPMSSVLGPNRTLHLGVPATSGIGGASGTTDGPAGEIGWGPKLSQAVLRPFRAVLHRVRDLAVAGVLLGATLLAPGIASAQAVELGTFSPVPSVVRQSPSPPIGTFYRVHDASELHLAGAGAITVTARDHQAGRTTWDLRVQLPIAKLDSGLLARLRDGVTIDVVQALAPFGANGETSTLGLALGTDTLQLQANAVFPGAWRQVPARLVLHLSDGTTHLLTLRAEAITRDDSPIFQRQIAANLPAERRALATDQATLAELKAAKSTPELKERIQQLERAIVERQAKITADEAALEHPRAEWLETSSTQYNGF